MVSIGIFSFAALLSTVLANTSAAAEESSEPLYEKMDRLSDDLGANVTSTIILPVQTIPPDVKEHEKPNWLDNWEDLEYGVLDSKVLGPPALADSTNITVKAAAYAFAHATGIWDLKVKKRDEEQNDEKLLMSFWDSGVLYEDDNEVIEKRAWACFSRVTRCIKDSRHVIGAVTLSAMSEMITGGCGYWYDTGASSLCMHDSRGERGCWSWSGGWHSMLGCVLKAGLDEVANDFGYSSSYSCYCPKAIQEGDWKKRTWYKDQLCISNRPDGCGSTSHQETHSKRFNYDVSGYAWCST